MYFDIASMEYMFLFKYHQSFEDATALYEKLKESAQANSETDKSLAENLLSLINKIEDRTDTATGILIELKTKEKNKTKITEIESEIRAVKDEIVIAQEYKKYAESILGSYKTPDKGE